MPSRLKSSLGLAELDNVAPDDEGSRHVPFGGDASDAESDASEKLEANRDHYTQVGTSQRRRKANLSETSNGTLDSGKYKGRLARSEDLLKDNGSDEEGDETEDEEDSEDGEDSQGVSESISASDSEVDSELDGPSEFSRTAASKSRKVRFESEGDSGSFASEEEGQNTIHSSGPPRSLASTLNSQAELVSSLRDSSQQDAARGKQIKDQLALWQRTLQNRIKVEKIVGTRGLGRVQPGTYRTLLTRCENSDTTGVSSAEAHHTNLLSSILAHSAFLLETQLELIGRDSCPDDIRSEIQAVGEKRKRIQSDEESLDEDDLRAAHQRQLSACLRFGAEVLQPFASSVFNGPSMNASTSALRDSNSNKFDASGSTNGGLKALNQSIDKQVAAALAGEGEQRLVDRTRRFRGDASARIGSSLITTAGGGADAANSEDSARRKEAELDAETFDDSDFYSSLLRSLIDSSSTAVGNTSTAGEGLPSAVSLFHPRTNTKSRGIDTRASKGRKLRYEVVEKVANFMPRIENRERWTEEMKERLFDILPGRVGGADGSEDSDAEDENAKDQPVGLGGLQLFA